VLSMYVRGRERYEDLALFDGLARLSRPSPCFAPLASLSPPGRGIRRFAAQLRQSVNRCH